jgi:molecular chaperone GrpE (heat shock protein)
LRHKKIFLPNSNRNKDLQKITFVSAQKRVKIPFPKAYSLLASSYSISGSEVKLNTVFAWLGYGVALFLTLFLLVTDFPTKGSNPAFIWEFLIAIVLLLLPIFLQFNGLRALLEKFISSVGDIENYRRELFKFKTEIVNTLNTQIKQEIVNANTVNLSVVKTLEEYDIVQRKVSDLIDNTNLNERKTERIIDYYFSLVSRRKLYNDKPDIFKDKIDELTQVMNQYERILSDIGVEVYKPQIGSVFDDRYQEISTLSRSIDSDAVSKLESPGIRINGKVIRKAKVFLESMEE